MLRFYFILATFFTFGITETGPEPPRFWENPDHPTRPDSGISHTIHTFYRCDPPGLLGDRYDTPSPPPGIPTPGPHTQHLHAQITAPTHTRTNGTTDQKPMQSPSIRLSRRKNKGSARSTLHTIEEHPENTPYRGKSQRSSLQTEDTTPYRITSPPTPPNHWNRYTLQITTPRVRFLLNIPL